MHNDKRATYNIGKDKQNQIYLYFFIKPLDIFTKACIIIKHLQIRYRGVEQLVARRAHNPEVAGSSPVPATMLNVHNGLEPL